MIANLLSRPDGRTRRIYNKIGGNRAALWFFSPRIVFKINFSDIIRFERTWKFMFEKSNTTFQQIFCHYSIIFARSMGSLWWYTTAEPCPYMELVHENSTRWVYDFLLGMELRYYREFSTNRCNYRKIICGTIEVARAFAVPALSSRARSIWSELWIINYFYILSFCVNFHVLER